jgi:signal transduction histidine kinase
VTGEADIDAGERVHAELDEQAALRRVATLVAEGMTSSELFAVVVAEAARALDAATVVLGRYEANAAVRILASLNGAAFSTGSSWKLDGPSVAASVLDTGKPSRIDDYSELPGSIAAGARESQLRSTVGVPIVVDGIVWGVMATASTAERPLPTDVELRLARFTGLVAIAIANAHARDELHRLADQQSALRRVATLIAAGSTTADLWTAVVEEVARVMGAPAVCLLRYGPERSMTVLAVLNDPAFVVGTQWPLDGASVTAAVLDTALPARIDDYSNLNGTLAEHTRESGFLSSLGVPIIVDGTVWGAICVGTKEADPFLAATERRLADFTDLVATAISNAQFRDDLCAHADEQAALSRVATLVAEGAESSVAFDAVCQEAGRLVGATSVNLSHYTPDGFNVTIAGWSLRDTHVPVGTRYPLTPDTIGGRITETRAPVRIEAWEGATDELARQIRERGVRSSLDTPIVVDGQLWGALVAATDTEDPLPSRTEVRLARFARLIATAVSNATARSELIASRARIVAAGDEARKRIERNLHDGTQQRLLAIGLDVQRITASVSAEEDDLRIGLERVSRDLESVLEDVRELSRGLHPQMLSRRGLRTALVALARHSPIPVDLDIELDERPPEQIETAVYYAVSEALTNAIKHSNASAISVRIATDHPGGRFATGLDDIWGGMNLHVAVADDGDGGATPTRGAGLAGLVDRIDALGGRLSLESPPGRGTRIAIALPLTSRAQP